LIDFWKAVFRNAHNSFIDCLRRVLVSLKENESSQIADCSH
jgi:hypothetical protein